MYIYRGIGDQLKETRKLCYRKGDRPRDAPTKVIKQPQCHTST